MKKILLIVCLVAVSVVYLCVMSVHAVDSAVVVSVKGRVSLQNAGAAGWKPVSEGQPVAERDSIRTGNGAAVEVGFADGSMISIDENSDVSVEVLRVDIENKLYQTRIKLDIGQVISKIQKFKNKNSGFEVRSPAAVTAVRGTEFVVSVDQSGETTVAVFDGMVGMAGYTPDGEVDQNEVPVQESQESSVSGTGDAPSEPAEMSPEMAAQEDKVKNLSSKAEDHKNKVEAQKKEEKKEEKKEKKKAKKEKKMKDKEKESKKKKKGGMAGLREEMRAFVDEVKVDISEKQEIVDEVAQSDFAEGKILRDVHGNLVEVGQFIQRPASDELHFIGVVMRRSGYKYNKDITVMDNGDQFMKYTGEAGKDVKRMDSLVTKFKFSEDVPEEVSQWPSAFTGESASGIEIVNAEAVLSNNQSRLTMKLHDANDFYAGSTGEEESEGMEGGMPELMYIEYKQDERDGTKWVWGDKKYIGPAKKDGEYSIMEDAEIDGGNFGTTESYENAVELWGGIHVGLYSKKPGEVEGEEGQSYFDDYEYTGNTDIRFAGFGIDTGGNVKGTKSFFDPDNFDILNMNETLDGLAGEIIFSSGEFAKNANDKMGNIDLIVTPNTFLSIVDELIDAAPDLFTQN